jgi:hypothetical protein
MAKIGKTDVVETPGLPYPAISVPEKVDVVIGVQLGLILGGIEALNDLAEERIVPDGHGLSDISFQVVGGRSKGNEYIGGEVLLRVRADVVEY